MKDSKSGNGEPDPPEIDVSGGHDLTINHGASASLQFTIKETRIATGISLSVSGLPNGVTAGFTPSSLPQPAPSQNVTLKLTVAATALASATTLQVHAHSGTHTGSQAIKLIVASPFSFAAGAPVLPIGTTGESIENSNTPVKLAAFGRINVPLNLQFDQGVGGTISLAVTSALPTGVTSLFSPSPFILGGAGSIVVNLLLMAGANVAPGTVTVTVVARVGTADRSKLTFPLIIVPPFVSGVSPTLGLVAMFRRVGTPVTVTGGGFGPGTTVAFGADAPVSASSVATDGTSLVVMVSRTATSGLITVMSPAGTASGPNFAVDNYRNTRGFSFENSNAQSVFGSTWTNTEAAALFGPIQSIAAFGPFMAAFLVAVDVLLDHNGLCFGMCQTSLRFATGQLSSAAFPQFLPSAGPSGPIGPDVWTLDGPGLRTGPVTNPSPGLLALIHQQHMAQFSQENIDNWIGFHIVVTTGAELRAAILSAFGAGNQSGVGTMVALNPSVGEGHVVVAYDLVDTSPGNFDVLLYNPNTPFNLQEDVNRMLQATNASDKSVIHVMSDGSWTFPELSWSGNIGGITVIPWNMVPLVPTFPFPEAVAAFGTAGALIGILVVFVAGDAEVTQISDAQGHTLLADGQLNTESTTRLVGVRPMPALGGLGKKSVPAFVGKGHDRLSHVITGKADGNYSITWFGHGVVATVSGVQTTAAANDVFSIDRGKVGLTVSSDKPINLKMLGLGTISKRPRMATLKTIVSRGDAIHFAFDSQAETFEYTHHGKATNYSLAVSTLNARGQITKFSTLSTSVAKGDTITFRPQWEALPKGKIETTIRNVAGKIRQHRAK